MNNLRDLRVLVLGLGDSGLAMAAWCARHGAHVRVWDSREAPPQAAALALAAPQATLHTGALEASLLDDVQLVLKSPGLAPRDERIAPRLAAARARGIAVQGELDLFARALADLHAERGYTPEVLAITGTNGKTTTTALTALLVERCGRRVAMAGNIGPTLLDTLAAAIDAAPRVRATPPAETAATAALDDGHDNVPEVAADTAADTPPQPVPHSACDEPAASEDEGTPLPDVWVLELSSFQLDGGGQGVQGFEPSAATVLNVTQDHLDWHGSMDAYAGAKARAFGRWATMVINRDDPLVEAMVPPPPPPPAKGKLKAEDREPPRHVVRFGLDAPTRAGDFGLVVENGIAWMVRAVGDEDPSPRKRGAAVEEEELHMQRLMPADALRIRGRHNAANAMAALALATSIGCPLAPMLHGLREYRGEPHRVAFVGSVGGVEAFDDSKGTNVGATVAALNGLGADKAPAKLVVLLGGDGKGQDFAPLAAPVTQHARAVALIGRDAPAIEAALSTTGVPMARHDSLEAATAWCFAQAKEGDAVLLSPACASLDMFRNYAHRAEVFVAAVQSLAQERGEIGA